MRSIICVLIMVVLIGLTGCAKKDAAPADHPEAQSETQPISTEDFESGEAEGAVEEVEGVVEEAPAGGDSDSTP